MTCDAKHDVCVCSRWQPQLALEQAQQALSHMATHADRLNATLADNDDTERFAISPGLWLMARAQVRIRER